LAACIYFTVVGSIRLKSIQKYPVDSNRFSRLQIIEIALISLTIAIILLLTFIEKSTTNMNVARGFSRLAVTGTWVRSPRSFSDLIPV
jgi:hypothetical protein